VHYEYDALGRRIAKRVEAATGGAPRTAPDQQEVTRFLWQGLRLLQEQRPGRRRLYLYLPGGRDERSHTPLVAIDEALSETGEVKEAQTCHYHTDTAGTAIAVSDGKGDVVWRGQYYAWGHPVTAVAVDGQELAASRVFQPLRYAGQYADDETTLCHNGSRYYDPGAGRYVSPDRTGPGGVSPYRYAPNPLTWCNPAGMPVPQQSFGAAAERVSADPVRALDPAHQFAGIVDQFHDVALWNPLERADEHGFEI
jgi:RHS repeat-associated protein